ncbi:hypothetical protein ACIBKX_16510 [Streptomyces sp. NPDC050658]|uniref:hypothetical protein n=1 Tax=unclassified Streptomyces TaxID=2593676 RepID=UPI0034493011
MDGAKPVQVLFTPDEYAALLRHADQLGLPVDEFIRRAVTVDAAEPPCPTAGTRRGPGGPAVVPPIRRGLGPDGTPALQRFLDTLAVSAEPAPSEKVPPQPTVRTCSGQ